ncbi:MAG: hypothetical protein H0T79_09005 [Deltaproteobacteria bacterium]|nr:hypothetical protein [Deltaproteobacteria bacterium]
MRFLHAVLISSLVACAHAPAHHVNVAAVRSEIKVQIGAERTIVSMGKTTHERAVVYTRTPDNKRNEETWVRAGGAWKLEGSAALEASAQ